MYLLESSDSFSDDVIGIHDRVAMPDRFVFSRGQPVHAGNVVPVFSFSAPARVIAEFDLLDNDARLPLVSARFADLLQRTCDHDVQLIPARLKTGDSEVTGFFLLNIVSLVSAIDLNASTYACITGTTAIRKFTRVTVRDGVLGDHWLARESSYLSYVWCSESLKQRVEVSGLRGLEFVAPEQIHA